MKLYVGSRDYCPKGYKTVDIDDSYNPDYVANIVDMHSIIEDESCDEIVANAVLEHIEWPDSFKAISEFARVLKKGGNLLVSVPDLDMICKSILDNLNPWYSTALLFGVGGRESCFEAHRFSFSRKMMTEMLEYLGFDEFEYFNSDFPDSSNGWMYTKDNTKIGISLNIKCKKVRDSFVDSEKAYELLLHNPMSDFGDLACKAINLNRIAEKRDATNNDYIMQSLAFKLIDANQRIQYLENEIKRMESEKKMTTLKSSRPALFRKSNANKE